MRTPRIYLDTSVIGGYFDPEFADATRQMFSELAVGRLIGVISGVVLQELVNAPPCVRQLLEVNPGDRFEVIPATEEAETLAEAFLAAGIVGPQCADDCRHVALAFCANVDILTSWNCRHIVQYERIRAFNALAVLRGFRALEIRTPREVIHYED